FFIVKRSSDTLKQNEVRPHHQIVIDDVNKNKKSSPEIVPASFNNNNKLSEISPPFNSKSQHLQKFPLQQRSNSFSSYKDDDDVANSKNELISSIIAARLAAAAVKAELESLKKQRLHNDIRNENDNQEYDDDDNHGVMINKRGVNNQQYLYGANNEPLLYDNAAYYNPYGGYMAVNDDGIGRGVWGDGLDIDNIVYTDMDEYEPLRAAVPPTYKKQAYDDLQNLLNAEYSAILPYNYERYPDLEAERNKKAYRIFSELAKNYPDMRNKRDNKLTPADMLALVALVEAGERARKETDHESTGYNGNPNENYAPKPYGIVPNTGFYDYPTIDDSLDYNNNDNWNEPPALVDYYGAPANMEPLSKYNLALKEKENRYRDYNDNRRARYGKKRLMVNKQKRSLAKPTALYKGRY
uniref:Uncharacterized protein n=1 Tax=Glossina brevipalpis TaxID=37001 RepID=A0A1A9WUB7_9MUSC